MRTLINAVDEAGAVLAVAQRTAKLLSGLAKELGTNRYTNEKLLRARLEMAGVDKALADKFIARVWAHRDRRIAEIKRQANEDACRLCFHAENDFDPK
jgi:hypothetical protein